MKALVGAFNQENALEGAFSVIVKSSLHVIFGTLRLKLYAAQGWVAELRVQPTFVCLIAPSLVTRQLRFQLCK